MDLVDGREFCVAQKRSNREATVLLDRGTIVMASVTNIQACKSAA